MSYLPLTDTHRKEMLRDIGVSRFDSLLSDIPRSLLNPPITLPDAVSELELRRLMQSYAQQNCSGTDMLSFVGAGAYEHFIPAVVNHVTSRSEFYTAYTPYQAEASQGTLQAIYEYQTLICRLTGMDVSNASHYDGATSMAEAALLSVTMKRRRTVVVARTVHPEYRTVLKTYMGGTGLQYVEIPCNKQGEIRVDTLKDILNMDVACFIVQSPNFLGLVEDFTTVEQLAHKIGAHFIVVANPLSLGRFKSPGEWNADIACGEGQVLGIPLSFGGPYLGYFATKKELMRKIPGRLVGISEDAQGRRMFTLTLQAREQHIRRERATSNICSNQALCALAAAVYLTALGKEGVQQVADLNIQNANYLREHVAKIPNYNVVIKGPIFNEFVVETPDNPATVINALLSQGINPGLNVKSEYPELGNALLMCATETKTKEDLDHFIDTLERMK